MFKAKHILSKEAVEETSVIYMKQIYIRFALLAILGSALLCIIVHFLMRNVNDATKMVMRIEELIGALVVVVICIVRAIRMNKKLIRRTTDQIQTVYHTDHMEKEFEVSDGAIHIVGVDGAPKDMYLSDIIKVKETQNYVIIMFKGSLVLNVLKKSIEGGSVTEFIAAVQP